LLSTSRKSLPGQDPTGNG